MGRGRHELDPGAQIQHNCPARCRKRADANLTNRLAGITALVDSRSQSDPRVRSTRLYTRLSGAEVRRQLIAQKGYTDAELPTVETIRTKLNDLGYSPTKVAKTQPQKKLLKPTLSSSK